MPTHNPKALRHGFPLAPSQSGLPFRLIGTLTLLFFAAMTSMDAWAEHPNVIIVMPDDMGYGDLGATGNPIIRTPNLDRFASESATLTQFYVSPVCSPTRASLMTGRYNHRTRVIDTFKGRSMMDPDEVTLAEALKSAGYATGIFGKWHLGDNYPLRPQDQGFDEVLVHKGGGLAQPSEPIENKSNYTNPILFRNGKKVQTKGYCTDVYFDAAIQFMKNAVDRGEPFFAYIPPNAPHGPYHDVPEDLREYYASVDLDPVLGKDKSDRHRDTVSRVYAMIENIDQNMGRLESFLEQSNLKRKTLVFFFTDNGPNTRRYAGPFRGMKSEVHAGGIRTCFFARWPGRFEPGHQSDRIAAHLDLAPTILDAANVDVSQRVSFDGRSVLPLLDGSSSHWPDRILVLQSHRGNQPISEHHIAVRSQNWKLVHPTGFGREQMPENVEFELYQPMSDVGENRSVAKDHPMEVARLREAYSTWLKSVSSTRANNYSPPRILIGSSYEPTTELSLQDWRVPKDSAGWGEGGRWEVKVVADGSFHAHVTFADPPGPRKLKLRIGNQSYSAAMEEGQTEARFEGIELVAGEKSIRVESIPVFKRTTLPRFVSVSRHD